MVVDALGEGEKRRRGRGEEEKAQSEKREAVAAFRGRERGSLRQVGGPACLHAR